MRLDSATAKRSPGRSKSTKTTARPSSIGRQCDRCAYRGTPVELRQHRQQEHMTFDERLEVARWELALKRARATHIRRSEVGPLPTQVRCTFCKKTFDLEQYEQHRPCAAGTSTRKQPPVDSWRKQPIYKRPNALRACEHCGIKLLPLPLKHHMKREHPDRKCKSGAPSTVPSSSKRKRKAKNAGAMKAIRKGSNESF